MQNFLDRRRTLWRCADTVLECAGKPLVMGILNVTPDSFSDGGEHAALEAAVAWARRLRSEGADIIDVGGESTRPGASSVPLSLERERVMPLVRALSAEGFVVSVDTSKPEIMLEAAANGAKILNDTRGFSLPGAEQAAAATGCGLVVMHWADVKAMTDNAVMTKTVFDWLSARRSALAAAGAELDRIALDPGLGFGKRPEQTFALLAALPELVGRGSPVLIGISRKKSLDWAIGRATAPKARDGATAAVSVLAAERGAAVVRVHDVRSSADALAVRAKVAALSTKN